MGQTATKGMKVTNEVLGVTIPKGKDLINFTNKGKYIIEFENPKLSGTQYIGPYRDANGKLHEYRNPVTNDMETIALTPPRVVYDLSTEEGRRKKAHIQGFNLAKRLGLKVKITDTSEQAAKTITLKDKEYDMVAKVRPHLEDKHKLLYLALNLGKIEVDGVDAADIKAAVYNRISANPDEVERVLGHPDYEYKGIIFHGAKAKVLTEKMGAYFYGAIYMGANIDQAVIWARNNPDIFETIKKDLQ